MKCIVKGVLIVDYPEEAEKEFKDLGYQVEVKESYFNHWKGYYRVDIIGTREELERLADDPVELGLFDKEDIEELDKPLEESSDKDDNMKTKEMLSKIGDDWSLKHLEDTLFELRGKTDNYAGELVRAVSKIEYWWVYHKYKFFEGKGIETVGPSVYFLLNFEDENGKNIFHDFIIGKAKTIGSKGDNKELYADFVEELKNKVIDYIKNNPDVLSRSKDKYENMCDVKYSVVADTFDAEGIIPDYNYTLNIEFPPELRAHIEMGNIGEDDIRSWAEDVIIKNIQLLKESPNGVSFDITADNIYVTHLNKITYEKLKKVKNVIYRGLKDWVRRLNKEWGNAEKQLDDWYD